MDRFFPTRLDFIKRRTDFRRGIVVPPNSHFEGDNQKGGFETQLFMCEFSLSQSAAESVDSIRFFDVNGSHRIIAWWCTSYKRTERKISTTCPSRFVPSDRSTNNNNPRESRKKDTNKSKQAITTSSSRGRASSKSLYSTVLTVH
jgi:hypothetical protein